jgi:allantoin racemase
LVSLDPSPARRGSFARPPIKPNSGLPEGIARLLARTATAP